MTYDPAIPTDLPPPNIAVDQIRTNFSQYASVFDNNHVALNATHQGKHSNVIFQRQSVDPTIDGDFDALYGKSVTSSSSTADEVFIKIPQFLPNEFPNNPMQLTFNSVNTSAPVYQSFIAGGYIIYFGSTSNIAIPITLSPTPSSIECVIANGNGFTTVGTPIPFDASVFFNSPSQFTISSVAATGVYRFSWFAIGKQ